MNIDYVSDETIKRILAATDWDRYWEGVRERSGREIDAYETARFRSYQTAAERWIR